MSVNLKIFLIILLIFQVVLIINRLKRKKMTMKYASFWILLIIIMGVIVVFPTIVFKLSKLAGFEEPSNMIFLLGFFYLFYVSFIITTSISVQNEKIKNFSSRDINFKRKSRKKWKEWKEGLI